MASRFFGDQESSGSDSDDDSEEESSEEESSEEESSSEEEDEKKVRELELRSTGARCRLLTSFLQCCPRELRKLALYVIRVMHPARCPSLTSPPPPLP